MLTCDRLNLVEMESLGQKVRRLREARAMSQEELAAAAGVSRNTIQNLEGDIGASPRGKTLRAVAVELGVEVGVLLGGLSESPPPGIAAAVQRALAALQRNDASEAERLLTDVLLTGGVDSVASVAGTIAPPPSADAVPTAGRGKSPKGESAAPRETPLQKAIRTDKGEHLPAEKPARARRDEGKAAG